MEWTGGNLSIGKDLSFYLTQCISVFYILSHKTLIRLFIRYVSLTPIRYLLSHFILSVKFFIFFLMSFKTASALCVCTKPQ